MSDQEDGYGLQIPKHRQMAKINNISVPTLRFYDSNWNPKPCYTDPPEPLPLLRCAPECQGGHDSVYEELRNGTEEIEGEVLASEDLRKIEAVQLIRKREQTIHQIEQMKIQLGYPLTGP